MKAQLARPLFRGRRQLARDLARAIAAAGDDGIDVLDALLVHDDAPARGGDGARLQVGVLGDQVQVVDLRHLRVLERRGAVIEVGDGVDGIVEALQDLVERQAEDLLHAEALGHRVRRALELHDALVLEDVLELGRHAAHRAVLGAHRLDVAGHLVVVHPARALLGAPRERAEARGRERVAHDVPIVIEAQELARERRAHPLLDAVLQDVRAHGGAEEQRAL